MRNFQAEITKRLAAAVIVVATVVGVSALAIHMPTQNQKSVARSLQSIQTDKATLFYAESHPTGINFVELVLSGTTESKAATENLKLIAATL